MLQWPKCGTVREMIPLNWPKMCYKSIGRYRLLYDNFYSFPLAASATFRLCQHTPPKPEDGDSVCDARGAPLQKEKPNGEPDYVQ